MAVGQLQVRHPRPEVLVGSVWKDGKFFMKAPRVLLLEDTILHCRKSENKETTTSFNLLNCTCISGRRPDQVVILNNRGRRVLSFSSPEHAEWLGRIKYACAWGVKKHFKLEREIGHGAFGRVFFARSMKGEEVAVKVIDMQLFSEFDKRLIFKEMSLLPSLNHPNIVPILDVFIDHSSATVSIAMEYMREGDLLDYIKLKGPLTEEDAKTVIRQLLDVLVYLHSSYIAHRDIKPENILLRRTDGEFEIGLTDFGCADRVTGDGLVVDQEDLRFNGGTVGYMAPEIQFGEQHDTAVDLWACGVVLYILLSGQNPFGCLEAAARLRSKSMLGDYNFRPTAFRNVSEDAKCFIRSLLLVRPNSRATAQSALLHRWLTPQAHLPRPMKHSETKATSTRALWCRAVLATVFLGTWRSEELSEDSREPGVFKYLLMSGNTRRRLSGSFLYSSQLDIASRNTAEAE